MLTPRYATTADVPEIVRLREVMWRSMGLPIAENAQTALRWRAS